MKIRVYISLKQIYCLTSNASEKEKFNTTLKENKSLKTVAFNLLLSFPSAYLPANCAGRFPQVRAQCPVAVCGK